MPWPSKSARVNCGTCKFFERVYATGGQCQRFPPQLVVEQDYMAYSRWPKTSDDAWCGEWQEPPTDG